MNKLFSIDEFKLSSLVIILLIVTGCSCYAFIKSGDISSNWLILIQTLICSIGGINALGHVATIVGTRKDAAVEAKLTPTEAPENIETEQKI